MEQRVERRVSFPAANNHLLISEAFVSKGTSIDNSTKAFETGFDSQIRKVNVIIRCWLARMQLKST